MSKIYIDNSRRRDIVARKGATFQKTLLVQNTNESNYDFTDHTVTLEVFNSPADTTAKLTFSEGAGLTLASGQIILSKTAAQMANLRRNNDSVYFLWVTNALGYKSLWLNGYFIINEGINDTPIEEEETIQVNVNGDTIAIEVTNPTSAPIPIEVFAEELIFNHDKELAFYEGGALSFTLSEDDNVNGIGVIMKLNLPTSVSFSADFIALPNSQDFDSAKMNIVTLLYMENYDGANTKKVLYNNNQLTAI